jgi:Porin PorA
MKRIGAYVALLLGVFLLVLGLSVKFVVAPKAVTAPLQIPAKYQTLIATGDNFTMLNSTTGKEDSVSVYITRHIEGDTVGDNRGDGTNAVYEESLCLMRVTAADRTPACGNGANLITSSVDRVAFNRVNGYATNNPKYDASVDGDSIPHEGLGYKFPIDTKKSRTYQYFDTVVGKAFPMTYVDQEKLQGLTVYKFVQRISNQPCYTNRTLPSTYSNTRTVWVEPTTGAIIKGSENLKQTLTGRAGLDATSAVVDPGLKGKVALQGLLTFTGATQKNQAALAKDNLPKVKLVRLWIPLIGVVLGVILIGLGVFLLLRRRDEKRVGQHQAPVADPARTDPRGQLFAPLPKRPRLQE